MSTRFARHFAAAPLLGLVGVILVTATIWRLDRPLPRDDRPGMAMGVQINVNEADGTTLQLLPGIGPALAARIVEYRTEHGHFENIDAIGRVRGIGPVTIARTGPWICLEPGTGMTSIARPEPGNELPTSATTIDTTTEQTR